jgi:transposase
VGRLIAAHFADPARLAHLSVERFRDFAARRGVQVNRRVAGRLVTAARAALPTCAARKPVQVC